MARRGAQHPKHECNPAHERIWHAQDVALQRVKVRDDAEGGFHNQTGTVIDRADNQDLKVRLDNDPNGPYCIFRADELTSCEGSVGPQ